LAALAAQDSHWRAPQADELLTGNEFADRYLLPLAASDLLAGRVHENERALGIGRHWLLKGEAIDGEDRSDALFVIHLDRGEKPEAVGLAKIVIDATGTFARPNWLGIGGIPAIGERAACRYIEYHLPDPLGADREDYAGKDTLVVGGGYSAATTVVALSELARKAPATRVTWVTREDFVPGEGPIRRIKGDRLPARDALAAAANELAAGASPAVRHFAGSAVQIVSYDLKDRRFAVTLTGTHLEDLEVDRVVANVGYRPNRELCRELHIHECYASEGPMGVAKTLVGASGDCLNQRSPGPAALMTPEPNYFILGAKSYGRNSKFLLSAGLEQVRDVFKIIAGRDSLDLYATMATDGTVTTG
jgi:thioredoxin reductase